MPQQYHSFEESAVDMDRFRDEASKSQRSVAYTDAKHETWRVWCKKESFINVFEEHNFYEERVLTALRIIA